MSVRLDKTALRKVTIAASDAMSPRNDTANIVELPGEMLLVVWHKYRASHEGASDFGVADIAGKISRDRGLTWTDERIMVEKAPVDLNAQAPALCLLPTGELLLGVMRAHGHGSSSLELFRSRDLGRTWTEAGFIWKKSPGQWLQGGASGFVPLAGGRLLLPFHGGAGSQHGQHNTVGVWASDDLGLTWRRTPACVDLPMRGAMESSIAQLPDGRLIMSLRSQLGCVMFSESRDEGETWSLPWSGPTAPESCTCLRAIPRSDRLLLIWNGCAHYDPAHHHFGERTPLSVAISADAGRTLTRLGDIEDEADVEYTNLNCTFTSWGDALITYLAVDPAFSRKAAVSELRAIAIPSSQLGAP